MKLSGIGFFIFLDFMFYLLYLSDRELVLWIGFCLAITNLIPYIGPYIGGNTF